MTSGNHKTRGADNPWPSIRELALKKGTHDADLSMSDRPLSYTSNDNNGVADPFGFRATYSALGLSLGVSYHF
jgi:hypothetical protein